MADDVAHVLQTEAELDALPEDATSSDIWRDLYGNDPAALPSILAQRLRALPTVPPGTELDYAQVTTDVTVNATAEATPTDIITLSAREYDGETAIMVAFYCPVVELPATAILILNLWDASIDLGRLGAFDLTASALGGLSMSVRITPAAGSHTYRVRGWRVNANPLMQASSPRFPMYLRTTKV